MSVASAHSRQRNIFFKMGLTSVVLGVTALISFWVPSGRLVADGVTEKIDAGGLINLGNRALTWTPYMSLTAPLSQIQSITSHFSFRTFDPEGALFYGDTNDGDDWFILSLRDGVPEMQIGKSDVLVSVAGGRKLNDGLWHKLELCSEGRFVVLEVDDQRELVLGLHSIEPTTQEGYIRLALGGILVSEKKLLVPLNPLLDGCIQRGSWLNLSTPWDATPREMVMPCFPNIKLGSFFPGTGLAIFNTSELPGVDPKDEKIIITIHTSKKWNGTLLSLQSQGANQLPSPILSVAKDTDSGMVIIKEPTSSFKDSMDFTSIDIIIQKTFLVFQRETVSPNSVNVQVDGDYSNILTQWNEGLLLAFGGAPGRGVDHSGSDYMEGCLDTIFIQGQKIDLDQAFFKDISVSSHSCPV